MTTPLAPTPRIRHYQNWLRDTRGLSFASYRDLWTWSTTDLEGFWQSIWDYFELHSPTPYTAVLARNVMPGARWFPGAQANYAHQVFRHVDAAHAAGLPAIISENEKGQVRTLSWPELRRQVAALALHLRAHGVQPGDRVAAYLPNVPETMVAFLATASIGAIWSVCAPDMGTNAVLDRFKQIEPKVLIACDGVTWAGRDVDRTDVVQALRAALPSVRHLIVYRNLGTTTSIADSADFSAVTARNDAETAAFEPLWLPFDHPLWVVYSSGTTGLPKPIVHAHGGMILVMLMLAALHNDVGCSYAPETFGERFHWYSSTGWVMWNAQIAGLLSGTTCVIYDGSPGGSKDAPDWSVLWRFAARHQVSFFGAGAAFYANCMKAGVDLARCGDLSRVRVLGTTGSPLAAEVQQWGTEQFRRIATSDAQRDIWWCNISGGTDFCGAFIGGNRELPQQPGVMQCRMLGAAVEAWNDAGEPVIGQVGELVCTQPIPSMPLHFWNDPGDARLLASYFEMYPPGKGRKPGGGDWLVGLDEPGRGAGQALRHSSGQALRQAQGERLQTRLDEASITVRGEPVEPLRHRSAQALRQDPAQALRQAQGERLQNRTDEASITVRGEPVEPLRLRSGQALGHSSAQALRQDSAQALRQAQGERLENLPDEASNPVRGEPVEPLRHRSGQALRQDSGQALRQDSGQALGHGSGEEQARTAQDERLDDPPSAALEKSVGSVWRHGDWLRVGDENGQGEWCVIFGRSDATINRHGLRMGTSEVYSAVEAIPEVLDSMVIDLEYLGKDSYMPLFVVLRPGVALDAALISRIHGAIRDRLSPRFVPDDIFQVAEIPRTLSGKKQELPIKKLLLGQPLEKVVNKEAMANPHSLDWYAEFARRRAGGVA